MKRLFVLLAFFTQFAAIQADTLTTFDFYLNDSLVQSSTGLGEQETIKLSFGKNDQYKIRVKFGCIASQYVTAFLYSNSLLEEKQKFDWLKRNSRVDDSRHIDLYLFYYEAKEKELVGLYKFYYMFHEDRKPKFAFKVFISYE